MRDIMATLFGFSGGLGFNRNWWDEHEHDGGMDTETIINGALGNRKTSFDGSFVDEHGGTIYLLDESDVFSCAKCHTHLASKDMIMSRAFQGRSGRCYLFETCVNCKLGNEEERMLITGRHVVCDVSCSICNTVLGWHYKKAYEPSQKYKEGRFILESTVPPHFLST
eukprot:343869_1